MLRNQLRLASLQGVSVETFWHRFSCQCRQACERITVRTTSTSRSLLVSTEASRLRSHPTRTLGVASNFSRPCTAFRPSSLHFTSVITSSSPHVLQLPILLFSGELRLSIPHRALARVPQFIRPLPPRRSLRGCPFSRAPLSLLS